MAQTVLCIYWGSGQRREAQRGEGHEEKGRNEVGGQEPDVVERAIGIGTLRNHWDMIKSLFYLAVLKSPLHRPDMRKEEKSATVTAAGEAVKEAVSKSYETSKHAAEVTAKLAGEAIQVTTKKVKRSVSSSRRPDADYDEF